GIRRVMWRQADNPLAPSDKYEARRAFPAFSRDYARLSVESERKNGGTRSLFPFLFSPHSASSCGESLAINSND
ncbi:hypothetical protein WN51_07988, partial [Melipona quadrifasciata]